MGLHPRTWPPLLVAVLTFLLVVLLSGMIASVAISMLGSLTAFRAAMHVAAPWLFLWRCGLYALGFVLWRYRLRPRTVARLRHDQDGGQAAYAMLVRLERHVLVVLALIELYNLYNWLGGA